MTSPNPIASTIILIFGLQAIVLIVLLLLKRPIKQSNVFLAMVLFFFALMSVNIALVNFLITYDRFCLYRYFQLELLFGIGPSLYFFTKSIADPAYRISRKEYIHFVPVILEFIYFRTRFYRIGLDERIEIYQKGSRVIYQSEIGPYSVVYLVLQYTAMLSVLVYVFLSLHLLIKYRQWIKGNYSNLKNKSLVWLRTPVFFYSGFYFALIILRSVDTFVFQDALKEFYFLPTFVGISIITCWIGFKGYVKSQTEVSGFSRPAVRTESKPSNLEEVQRMVSVMATQKPYLNPNLDLSTLSELIKINPKEASRIINHDLNTNFYEFVNKYRVEEFKQRLQQENRDKFTLLTHALESGFNSKSTFNHVFKKITGQTPGEYYRKVKN